MHITDTIADMLTRIRNANNAKHDTVDIPASNMKKAIAQILLDEGYIKSFQVVEDGKQGNIRVVLKYGFTHILSNLKNTCYGSEKKHEEPTLKRASPVGCSWVSL